MRASHEVVLVIRSSEAPRPSMGHWTGRQHGGPRLGSSLAARGRGTGDRGAGDRGPGGQPRIATGRVRTLSSFLLGRGVRALLPRERKEGVFSAASCSGASHITCCACRFGRLGSIHWAASSLYCTVVLAFLSTSVYGVYYCTWYVSRMWVAHCVRSAQDLWLVWG